MRENELERQLSLSAKQYQMLWLKLLGRRGIPDRVALFFPARAVFFELKTATGRLTKQQRFVHDILRKYGFPVHVVRSPKEWETILAAEGAPRKGTGAAQERE